MIIPWCRHPSVPPGRPRKDDALEDIHAAGFFVQGIRLKLILTLMVAALVPLVIGIASLHFLGNRYYLAQRGALYQVMAGQIAAGLERGLDDRVAWLSIWTRLGNLAEALPPPGPDDAAQTEASRRAEIDRIEAAWPTLTEGDEPLRGILRNPLSDALRRYARLNPLVVEILAADAYGRVVAATNKTSDYDQADEAWWTTAMTRVSPLQAFVEGIAFDESAQVYSIDVSVPLLDASGEAVGVLKAVVNATPLLQSLAPIRGTLTPNRDLVLDTGQVLVRLFGEAVEPFAESVGAGVTEALAEVDTGWRITPIAGQAHLVGFAQVQCSRRFLHMDYLSDIAPMAVIVYHPHGQVMAPVRSELLRLSVGGLGVAILFGLAGFYIASQRLLKPIDTLRSAAQCIAATAHLGSEERPSRPPAGRAQAEGRLREVEDIETHDELDDLARDFVLMGQRVLHYNEQLSQELAKRTEEMRQDLNMARQFQEALLPNEYPLVPEADEPCPISLIFRHVYTPTLSVGGDFFDVRKLSPHRASVFIADVMGHGTRSALVTAILHTLLRDADVAAADPATLLADINRRFQSIAKRTEDTLFVTAFFMVLDTRSASVQYACAGHPSPLVVSRPEGKVVRLVNAEDYGPALGLFEEPHFPCASRDLEPGDCYLLYTDGLTEAMNEDREEWGEERLQDTLRRAAAAGAQDLLIPTMADVHEFIGAATIHDDICLVTVEAQQS
jgi:phosphoserine phosphatase RsbU/P